MYSSTRTLLTPPSTFFLPPPPPGRHPGHLLATPRRRPSADMSLVPSSCSYVHTAGQRAPRPHYRSLTTSKKRQTVETTPARVIWRSRVDSWTIIYRPRLQLHFLHLFTLLKISLSKLLPMNYGVTWKCTDSLSLHF